MAYDPDDSGDTYPRRPLPQYLDNLIVEHPEIGRCELWKAICWDTAKLRNYKLRADSAGAIAEEAQKGSGQPKLAPPLVADSAKDEGSKMRQIEDALDALESRITRAEERKRKADEEAALRDRAEAALELAERIAESAPQAMLDSLLPAKPRLH